MTSYLCKNLKFHKIDRFNNPIFIATLKKDPENYTILKTIYDKVSALSIETFLPIYSHDEYKYVTVTFKTKSKFDTDHLYNIKFNIRSVDWVDKRYINFNIMDFSKGVPIPQSGEILTL